MKRSASFIALMEAGDFDRSPFDPLDLAILRLVVETTNGYTPELPTIIARCLRDHPCPGSHSHPHMKIGTRV